MYKIFDMDGTVYRILTVGYNLMLLNVLVIVTSLPILTIGPSIAAAVSLINENDDGKIVFTFKRYLYYFKKHLKKGMGLLGIQLGIIGVFIVLLLVLEAIPLVQLMVIILFSLALLVTSSFYHILVHYRDISVKRILSIALVIALKFTGIAALSFTVPFISLIIPIFLPKLIFPYVLVIFSVPLYIQHYVLKMPLNRIQIEEEWSLQND